MTFGATTEPPQIRAMPMSMAEEFPDEDGLKFFFSTELPFGNLPGTASFRADRPERNRGQYFYRDVGLDAPLGSLLVFQWNNQIVAQATLVTVRPMSGGGVYRGSYFLAPSSIRLIQPFVSQQEFDSIWPDKHFSNAKHKLAVTRFAAWNKLVADRLVEQRAV